MKKNKWKKVKQGTKRNTREPLRNGTPKKAQGFIWWICLLLIAGIVNHLCDGFFGVCSSVIKNTSSGFWHKFVDLYYAVAAQTEASDSSFNLESIWIAGMVTAGWGMCFLLFRISRDIDRSEGRQLGDEEKSENGTTSIERGVSKADLDKFQRRRKLRRMGKWNVGLLGVATVMLLFVFSMDMFSYIILKQERLVLLRIRPFITDLEYHQLNRQWVMMKSRSDYLDIKRQIEEYEKRGEDNDTAGEDGAPK